MKVKILLLLLCVIAFSPVADAFSFDVVVEFFEDVFGPADVTGMITLKVKSWGYKNVEKMRKFNTERRYNIVTKYFTVCSLVSLFSKVFHFLSFLKSLNLFEKNCVSFSLIIEVFLAFLIYSTQGADCSYWRPRI